MAPQSAPYHREELGSELLKKAAVILKKSGVEALSLRELGRAAGVSRSALYHHFKDKDALLQRLGANGFGQLAASIRNSAEPSRDPGARLKRGLRAYYDFALREPHLFTLMFANVLDRSIKPRPGQPPFAFSSPEAIAAFGLLFDGIKAWMAGRPKDQRDPSVVTNVFWAFTHGVAVLALDQNVKHNDPHTILDAGLDALMR